MSEPTVCCILLTRDRPELAARAVRAFRAQTYANKRLLIWDQTSGAVTSHDDSPLVFHAHPCEPASIGVLRNRAGLWILVEQSVPKPDVFVHWDSDDYSHTNRIAEQVALLQSSGAEVVGYNEMLFWDSRPGQFCGAYLYRNGNKQRPLGTSLCYWRSTWEAKPFPDVNVGEDTQWLSGLRVNSMTSFPGGTVINSPTFIRKFEPRMIATIHGGNTSSTYSEGKMDPYEWRRVSEWDAYCHRTLEEA